ncbi:MAG TPA: hypothetical protein VHU91_11160 [Mycobacteriales bacterium]|nr:hypothetical protein [Mycobacteriales bacterium]
MSVMGEQVVLIVSAAEDWSAEAVASVLRGRGVGVFIVDTGDFPQRMTVAAILRDGWSGRLVTEAGEIDLGAVTGVY